MKANIDAVFKNGHIALGMIARNDKSELVLLASKNLLCDSAFMAELESLDWATGINEIKSWCNVVWSLYATLVIIKVNSGNDLEG